MTRGGIELRADLTGAIPPILLNLGAVEGLVEHDGDAPPVIVLVAIETIPGRGAQQPSGPLDVVLRDAAGRDRLWAAGLRRSHVRAQRSIIRIGPDEHPVVHAGETLELRVTGNAKPGASVTVHLYYGTTAAQKEHDGGHCH